jgi:hypothetical protein
MRFKITREFRVPKGAIKVADKLSDAVAYLGTNRDGKAFAMLFVGKQSKPVWNYWFPNDARRAAKIEEAFKDRREHLERVKARRAEPSSSALRNRKLKEVMVAEFGEGKVTVHGSRGTAYGWVTLRIDVKPRDHNHRQALQARVWELIDQHKIHIGSYDSGDYGAGREIHIDFARE